MVEVAAKERPMMLGAAMAAISLSSKDITKTECDPSV